MPLACVLEALAIDRDASDDEIATRLRTLTGCPEARSRRPQLWIRLLDGFSAEVLRPPRLQVRDVGHLVDGLAASCCCWHDDVRWNEDAWAAELEMESWDALLGGVAGDRRERWAKAHERVGALVEQLVPPLDEAGLILGGRGRGTGIAPSR